MASYLRTGRVWQLETEFWRDPRDPAPGFDRFACEWQGEGPDGRRCRYGPSCVQLRDALRWCANQARRAFVDIEYQRFAVGEPADDFRQLPDVPPFSLVSWRDHAVDRWEIDATLKLGARDYADAAPGFELSLRSGGYQVLAAGNDESTGHLHARLVVVAPSSEHATVIAQHEIRRAATDLPDGLRDEFNNGFAPALASRPTRLPPGSRTRENRAGVEVTPPHRNAATRPCASSA